MRKRLDKRKNLSSLHSVDKEEKSDYLICIKYIDCII